MDKSNSNPDVKRLCLPTLSRIVELDNTENEDDVFDGILLEIPPRTFKDKLCKHRKTIQTIMLVLFWFVCSIVLMMKSEKVEETHQIIVPKNSIKDYAITEAPIQNKVKIMVDGAFIPVYYKNLSSHTLLVWVELIITKQKFNGDLPRSLEEKNVLQVVNISEIWSVPTVSEKLIGIVPEVTYKNTFDVAGINISHDQYFLRVKFTTNLKASFPISITYDLQPINMNDGIIYAALILVGLYVLIIFNITNKTLAAMFGTTMSIAVLAVLNARPTMSQILSWIDVDSLLLLFSMMIIVSITGETGIFNYLANLAYKCTRGKTWPLITTLCMFTAICSCFLDNVTTALLMTPITIRLCQVMKLQPGPVLMCMLVFSNIGGALTPIGDPPNVIIANNPDVIKAGVTFSTFIAHMSVGVFLSLFAVYLLMRFTYRNEENLMFPEPPEVEDLKGEIAVLERVASGLTRYSKDECTIKENLTNKIRRMLGKLHNTRKNSNVLSPSIRNGPNYLQFLQEEFKISDKVLLIKCISVLLLVILMFFLQSVPAISRLGMSMTAFLGAGFLLILHDPKNTESVLLRVEWSTLLFFASLFILMEALTRLGLIDWIGNQTQILIMSVNQENRLTVAILLILWVSAIASAFVDNIPLTTMMVRIATTLANNRELNLPLQPLIWALSFGACFGGNGTLFGSSSNIVCAGVAESHGHKLSFLQFMKLGFPAMMISVVIISVYLIIAHVVLQWH